MKELIEMLRKGNYTLVIANGNDLRCFTSRGVVDIYTIFIKEPQFLKGALIADKIIGKAAAAIMIQGNVSQVHTDVISEGALKLFNEYGIEIKYEKLVPHIINRDGSDWCPLELKSKELSDIAEIISAVGSFLQNMRIIS